MVFNGHLINKYMDEWVFFQMLCNVKGRKPNFETLEEKIKMILNFKCVSCNLVLYF
jgi:hypothetical protein